MKHRARLLSILLSSVLTFVSVTGNITYYAHADEVMEEDTMSENAMSENTLKEVIEVTAGDVYYKSGDLPTVSVKCNGSEIPESSYSVRYASDIDSTLGEHELTVVINDENYGVKEYNASYNVFAMKAGFYKRTDRYSKTLLGYGYLNKGFYERNFNRSLRTTTAANIKNAILEIPAELEGMNVEYRRLSHDKKGSLDAEILCYVDEKDAVYYILKSGELNPTGVKGDPTVKYVAVDTGLLTFDAHVCNIYDTGAKDKSLDKYLVTSPDESARKAAMLEAGFSEKDIEEKQLDINWYRIVYNDSDGYHVDGKVFSRATSENSVSKNSPSENSTSENSVSKNSPSNNSTSENSASGNLVPSIIDEEKTESENKVDPEKKEEKSESGNKAPEKKEEKSESGNKAPEKKDDTPKADDKKPEKKDEKSESGNKAPEKKDEKSESGNKAPDKKDEKAENPKKSDNKDSNDKSDRSKSGSKKSSSSSSSSSSSQASTSTKDGASSEVLGDKKEPEETKSESKVLGEKSSPKTGDDTNPLIWLTLFLASGAGIFARVNALARKKDNE